MDKEEGCEHEGCIIWKKPEGYAYKPKRPILFCRKCNNWIEVEFKITTY